MSATDFTHDAIEKSRASVAKGGFPAGAVIVKNDQLIASGVSIGNILNDPTSHGEIAAIRAACEKLGTTDLSGCVLYTSLEPCAMCLSAAMWASITNVVYACSKDAVPADFYGGNYATETLNHSFLKPINLVHSDANQSLALEVIKDWEKNYGKSD